MAEADLKVLDPVWTTAYITRNHAYLVYDTLFGIDENFQVKPQMVDRTIVSADGMKYTFTLRDGLRWHDGQPVVSEDCVESVKRWGKKDRFGQFLMAHTGKIAPIDKKSFTIELAERFGPVLDALGSHRPAFMMPARIASTPADEQIKEVIGSGSAAAGAAARTGSALADASQQIVVVWAGCAEDVMRNTSEASKALIRARSFTEMWQVQGSLMRQNLQSFLSHCARLTDIAARLTLRPFETFKGVSAEQARSQSGHRLAAPSPLQFGARELSRQ